jgi:hypothetical protein
MHAFRRITIAKVPHMETVGRTRPGRAVDALRTLSHCSLRGTSVMRDEERSQMTAAALPSHRDKCS